MVSVYSLYIFDRHCECVYYQAFARQQQSTRIPEHLLPGVLRPPNSPSSIPPNQRFANLPKSGVVVAQPNTPTTSEAPIASTSKGLPFDEEAKLVYGVVFSLRNMVKKMAGREEPFMSYKTSAYKLHFFETLSGYKFVLLSDAAVDSLRFVLRHIYNTVFQDHVIRNPFMRLDSAQSKRGIDSDAFRRGVDAIVSGLDSK